MRTYVRRCVLTWGNQPSYFVSYKLDGKFNALDFSKSNLFLSKTGKWVDWDRENIYFEKFDEIQKLLSDDEFKEIVLNGILDL